MATRSNRVFTPVSGATFAAIVEQRMADHKLWQHAEECRMVEEVIDEVQALPPRAPKRSGYLFELKPENMLTRGVQ